MSKSLNNAIYLSDDHKQINRKVMDAVTDPARIHKTDPGHPEVCTVYEYHKVFNQNEIEEIEADCRKGAIGCVACKKKLAGCLNNLLEPMRERREKYSQNPGLVKDILIEGTRKAQRAAQETMIEVREAMGINYFG
jgi:tryptophanyl-tRNA synthetase